jgi:hypothetical protein
MCDEGSVVIRIEITVEFSVSIKQSGENRF